MADKENVYTTPGKKNTHEARAEAEAIRFELAKRDCRLVLRRWRQDLRVSSPPPPQGAPSFCICTQCNPSP